MNLLLLEELFLTTIPVIDNTGYEVALWLSNNIDKAPENVYLHTLNPCGRKNMRDVLEKVKINVYNAPFLWSE